MNINNNDYNFQESTIKSYELVRTDNKLNGSLNNNFLKLNKANKD
jgi:hypothetical protein